LSLILAEARPLHRGIRLNTNGFARRSLAAGPASRMPDTRPRDSAMPKFVIERQIIGAGKLARQELQAISQKSCSVLQGMGPTIQWVQSYVTDDKIYCVYVAPDEGTVRTHAARGGFPAGAIARVRSVIDPTTAE